MTNAKQNYAEIDNAILSAIKSGVSGFNEISNMSYVKHAANAHKTDSRESWRVVDMRLQAMRRNGIIKYKRTTINNVGGWECPEGE